MFYCGRYESRKERPDGLLSDKPSFPRETSPNQHPDVALRDTRCCVGGQSLMTCNLTVKNSGSRKSILFLVLFSVFCELLCRTMRATRAAFSCNWIGTAD